LETTWGQIVGKKLLRNILPQAEYNIKENTGVHEKTKKKSQ
jgi:hypothetical protein